MYICTIDMSTPGFEPGFPRPQRDVLTTRLSGLIIPKTYSSHDNITADSEESDDSSTGSKVSRC